MLDWIPDPAALWRNPQSATMSMSSDPTWTALMSKRHMEQRHVPLRQFPLVTSVGDVPVHLVGAPTPASAYQPAPVLTNQPVVHVVQGETLQYTAQGENRDFVDHPIQNLSYSLAHHPMELARVLWDYARQGLGYIVWNYQDFYQQLQAWDGTVPGLLRHMGLWWRGAVVALITLGLLEIAPLLNALTTWMRMAFDLLSTLFRMTGAALDELWYLLERIWADVTSLWS